MVKNKRTKLILGIGIIVVLTLTSIAATYFANQKPPCTSTPGGEQCAH